MSLRTLARVAALASIAITAGIQLVYADDAAGQPNPFTLTLPAGYGELTKQVQTTKSPDGEIRVTNWVSKAPSGEAVVVTESKMPGKILDQQKLIASTRDALLKSLGATVESETAADANTAVLFHSNAAFFRARFAVIDDRFYQLLYVGRSAEQRTAPSVGQIFDSFAIAKTAADQTAQAAAKQP